MDSNSYDTNYDAPLLKGTETERKRRLSDDCDPQKRRGQDHQPPPASRPLKTDMDRRLYWFLAIPLVISCCVYFLSRSSSALRASPTLVKAFVCFRHGSRAPIVTYASDIYKNEVLKVWPEGYERLTKDGKKESYELGKHLHERYVEFLSPFYNEDEVKAFTTMKSRTIMSGQLVLSSLYPPVGYQLWNEDLNWQPVPLFVEYIFNDSSGANCPRFTKESKESLISEYHRLSPSQKEVIGKVMKNAGEPNAKPHEVFATVWDTLYFQDRAKLSLPTWANKIFPEPAHEVAISLVKAFLIGSDIQRRLLLWNYITAINAFFLSEDERKMEIHSWHDLNNIVILRTLGINVDRIPEPASSIVIELHNKNGNQYFEVYYFDNHKAKTPRQLEMPCGMSCSIKELKILEDQLRVDNYTALCNNGGANRSLFANKYAILT